MATKTLYVGNLPYDISDTQLREHFAKYEASNVRIIEGRGFGFVDVNSDNLESAILDNNQKDFGGRTLTVNEAQPKSNSGGGGGGGNRGGYGGGNRGGYGGGGRNRY